MATRKQGVLTVAKFNSWNVHLRPYAKRRFWHRERKAAKLMIKTETMTREQT